MSEDAGTPFPSGRQHGSARGNPDSRAADGPNPNAAVRDEPGRERRGAGGAAALLPEANAQPLGEALRGLDRRQVPEQQQRAAHARVVRGAILALGDVALHRDHGVVVEHVVDERVVVLAKS